MHSRKRHSRSQQQRLTIDRTFPSLPPLTQTVLRNRFNAKPRFLSYRLEHDYTSPQQPDYRAIRTTVDARAYWTWKRRHPPQLPAYASSMCLDDHTPGLHSNEDVMAAVSDKASVCHYGNDCAGSHDGCRGNRALRRP